MKINVYAALITFFSATLCIGLQAQDFEGGNLKLKAPLDEPDFYCFDIFGFGTGAETVEPISVHTCKVEGWRDATFTVDYPEPGQIYAPAYDMCAQVSRLERGAHLILQTCSDSELQRFIYRENQTLEMVLREGQAAFCVVVHPAEGIATGGPSHIRREVYVYNCDAVEPELAQWILPEKGTGLEAPAMDSSQMGPPPNPELAAAAGLYGSACARCHGYQGEGNTDLHAPKLSGQSEWYLKRQFENFTHDLRGYTKPERWANQMAEQVRGMDQLPSFLVEGMMGYIASFEDIASPATIDGDVARGEQLYQSTCTACHGTEGLGNAELNSPRLVGMTDWYMLDQMQKFRDGRRGSHAEDEIGAQMVPFARVLPDEQAVQDVIAYINTLSR